LNGTDIVTIFAEVGNISKKRLSLSLKLSLKATPVKVVSLKEKVNEKNGPRTNNFLREGSIYLTNIRIDSVGKFEVPDRGKREDHSGKISKTGTKNRLCFRA